MLVSLLKLSTGLALLATFLSCDAALAGHGSRVRLLSWRDYLAPTVVERLEQSGQAIEQETYETNDAALSRLIAPGADYDVAIVSNVVIPALRAKGLIETGVFAEEARTRGYRSLVADSAADCLPYLWGTTLFFYDSRTVTKAPTSLADLAALKRQGVPIAIVDDTFEVAARSFGDAGRVCNQRIDPERIFDVLSACHDGFLPESPVGFTDGDFVPGGILDQEVDRKAGYGWHAANVPAMLEHDWFRTAPAAHHPVVGYDAVCIMKHRQSGHSLAQLHSFAAKLTELQATHLNVEHTQYFSPYDGDTTGLRPRIRAILENVEADQLTSEPIVLHYPRGAAERQILQKWWEGVRQGRASIRGH